MKNPRLVSGGKNLRAGYQSIRLSMVLSRR